MGSSKTLAPADIDPEVRVHDDVRRLTALVERVCQRTGNDSWSTFNKLLDVALEASNALRRGDFAWEPNLNGWAGVKADFVEAVGTLWTYSVPPPTYQDVIGGLYMALGQGEKRFGQFFTPWTAARAMALITMSDIDYEKYTPEHPLRVMDPCCGSGVMLLAAASCLPREFIDQRRVVFYGTDIDPVCVKMARLNLMLYGLGGDHLFVTDVLRNPAGLPVAGARRPG